MTTNARPGHRGFYPIPVEERFWAKVDRRGPAECWIWLAARTGTGGRYGSFNADGRRKGKRTTVLAHVFAYELLIGPVPSGHDLHHLIEEGACSSTLCVNPAHLEPVTRREHVRRGVRGFAAINAAKERCIRGHVLIGENVYQTSTGGRGCEQCRSEYRASKRRTA